MYNNNRYYYDADLIYKDMPQSWNTKAACVNLIISGLSRSPALTCSKRDRTKALVGSSLVCGGYSMRDGAVYISYKCTQLNQQDSYGAAKQSLGALVCVNCVAVFLYYFYIDICRHKSLVSL